MTKSEEKKQLRKTIHALDAGLSPRYRKESDQRIAAHLLGMPEYLAADTVFCFVSMAQEIDTTPILEDLLRRGKRLCVPLCTGPHEMELRQITALSDLTPGHYGILEPSEETPLVPIDAVDFSILPCLSCNHLGQRLGRGGGYYDRFLSAYRGGSVLLCREKLIRAEIPVEPHDYLIPWVLTEQGLYEDGIPARLS